MEAHYDILQSTFEDGNRNLTNYDGNWVTFVTSTERKGRRGARLTTSQKLRKRYDSMIAILIHQKGSERWELKSIKIAHKSPKKLKEKKWKWNENENENENEKVWNAFQSLTV
jgi:hypothetical protein